jgi:soluble lytic murein transglycosylase-like protein
MNRFFKYIQLLMLLISVWLWCCSPGWAQQDPWNVLQNRFSTSHEKPVNPLTNSSKRSQDPWKTLRTIYLPFSEEAEKAALRDPQTGKNVSRHLISKLTPYKHIILEASDRFQIPAEIIGGLILVESGGNPLARAKTSSAKGLTQTISSTFQVARNALISDGIVIEDTPFDPKASVMAGCWYLNHMFEKADGDGNLIFKDRNTFANWKRPLEYYYVGPGHGRKKEDNVLIYANGKKVVINKAAYSSKVLHWAEILRIYDIQNASKTAHHELMHLPTSAQ